MMLIGWLYVELRVTAEKFEIFERNNNWESSTCRSLYL